MRPFRFLLTLVVAFGLGAIISTAVVAQTTSPVRLLDIRFVSTPTPLGIANQEYRYQARAIGRDTLAALRYRLTAAPRGMTIDSINGLLRWTTSASTTAPVRVSILAVLATSASTNVTQTFALTILSATAAQPTVRFTTTAPPTTSVGVAYTYQASAFYGVDPLLTAPPREQTGRIQYSLLNAPQGMTIDATRGTVRWTPAASGTVNFSIRAVSTTVATASATQNVEVRVIEARPIFATSPQPQAFVGQEYAYTALAVLPGVNILSATAGTRPGEIVVQPIAQRVPMTYTLITAPNGMTVQSTSGVVRWTPTTIPTTATVRVVLRASVVGGSTTQTVTQEFALRVAAAQMLITSQPPRVGAANTPYTYQAIATYGNLSSLVGIIPVNLLGGVSPNVIAAPAFTFSLPNPPQGMTIDATRGTVRWTPGTNGTFTVNVRATLVSNAALTTTQTYQLTITAPPQSLRFITNPGSVYADVGREFVYRARAQTSQPTTATIMYSFGATPPGARIDSLTGDIRWTPTIAGQFTMEIIARLPNGTSRPTEVRQSFPVYARASVCGLVQGVVRYTDGTVVVSATLRALVTNVTAASLGGSPFYYTATIRNGVYSLPIGAGSYILSVSGGDFNEVWFVGSPTNTSATATTPDRATPLTVRCGDTLIRNAVVPRRPAARFFAVSGRVTRRLDGAAVAGMIEAIGDADPTLVNGGIIRRTVRTDAQGNYRLTQLDNRYVYTFRALPDEPRPTTASVQAPQLLPQYFDNTLNLAEARQFRLSADLTNINFVLQERPTFNNGIVGKVQSATGVGIAGRIIAFMTSTTANTVPINLYKPIQTRSKLSSCFTERPIGQLSTGIHGRTARA